MIRVAVLATTLVLALSNGSGAQSNASSSANTYASVPFGVGERTTYKVVLGIVGDVGEGSLEVVDLDTVQGRPAYELRFRLKGGVPFARVDNDYHSWLDAYSLVARRFKQDQKEVRYERHRFFEFFPEEKRWRRLDADESGTMSTDEPLDDLSFLYFIRTLPLEVGRTYTLNRYFKDDGNPVTVKVLRKQTITVPAGRFNTIVVQPIIKTKGLFSEGGKAEVYFTDDDRRILVALKSRVKILKSLDMLLERYEPGERLAAAAQ
ncbi:MAG: DUF3108 domain-containing protein [Gemmatimonadota bacterium]